MCRHEGDDHGGRRKKQAVTAERAAPRQRQIDEDADDDRGQPHQGVEDDDHCAAPGKAGDGQPGAEGQADQGAYGQRGQADAQRQTDNFKQSMVEMAEQGKGVKQGGSHGCGRITPAGERRKPRVAGGYNAARGLCTALNWWRFGAL